MLIAQWSAANAGGLVLLPARSAQLQLEMQHIVARGASDRFDILSFISAHLQNKAEHSAKQLTKHIFFSHFQISPEWVWVIVQKKFVCGQSNCKMLLIQGIAIENPRRLRGIYFDMIT